MKIEARNILAGLIIGGLSGAGSVYAGEHTEEIYDAFHSYGSRALADLQNARRERSPIVASPTETPSPTEAPTETPRIVLDDSEPSPELLNKIYQSVVRVTTFMPPEYSNYGFGAYGCTGFITRDAKRNPIVLTARHCFPSKIKAADGKEWGSIDNGRILLQSQITGIGKVIMDTSIDNYFLSNPDDDKSDAIALSVDKPELTQAEGIPLGKAEDMLLGQRATMLSLDNEENFLPTPLYLIGNSGRKLHFLSIVNEREKCVPGKSGSAIVDNAGKVVAIHRGSNLPFVISEAFVKEHNLPKTLIGATGDICVGVSANALQGLIRNQ